VDPVWGAGFVSVTAFDGTDPDAGANPDARRTRRVAVLIRQHRELRPGRHRPATAFDVAALGGRQRNDDGHWERRGDRASADETE
jgi:hypothetical protein